MPYLYKSFYRFFFLYKYPGQDPNQGGYPGANIGFGSAGGFDAQPMYPYPSGQPGYPPSQPGYPQSQPGYPPSQPGYPQQPGYPSYPSGQPGGGYPPQQASGGGWFDPLPQNPPVGGGYLPPHIQANPSFQPAPAPGYGQTSIYPSAPVSQGYPTQPINQGYPTHNQAPVNPQFAPSGNTFQQPPVNKVLNNFSLFMLQRFLIV